MPLLISLAIVGAVFCIIGLLLLFYARSNREISLKTRQEAIWALTLKKKRNRKR